MKYISSLILALLVATSSWASTSDKPARVVSTMVKRAVIVEAVYPETRELKVLDAQGNRFRVSVDPMVTNFDGIEPRDRIVAEYIESVAIIVAPAGSEPLIGEGRAVEVDPLSDKPILRGAETRLLVATVEAINVADRLATIRTDDGDVHDVKVAKDARLDLVEVGDQVRLRITLAVAVAVTKPNT